nr:MAG TPA: hypothetical protein [Caudoviricetes sp.]
MLNILYNINGEYTNYGILPIFLRFKRYFVLIPMA